MKNSSSSSSSSVLLRHLCVRCVCRFCLCLSHVCKHSWLITVQEFIKSSVSQNLPSSPEIIQFGYFNADGVVIYIPYYVVNTIVPKEICYYPCQCLVSQWFALACAGCRWNIFTPFPLSALLNLDRDSGSTPTSAIWLLYLLNKRPMYETIFISTLPILSNI